MQSITLNLRSSAPVLELLSQGMSASALAHVRRRIGRSVIERTTPTIEHIRVPVNSMADGPISEIGLGFAL